MEVLNKLKSTVSNLSTALPGNPVTREYEVIQHIGSAGPGLLWKINRAVKRSTKQEAAVFVMEKKQLERYSKQHREALLENMKRGIAQLTRLRHPSVLTVQHPLEESRESLAFATEPVFASLANILGHHDNLPVPPPLELKDFQLFDVEIKFGLLQVSEGLAFLHNDVKMLHRNLAPESIVINKNGAWKIFGFEFSTNAINQHDKQLSFPSPELDPDVPPTLQPNLDYLAPEYVLTHNCSLASDMFSLGSLIYSIYNKGTPIYCCSGSLSCMKNNCNKLKKQAVTSVTCIPPDAQEHVRMMLNATPEIRPDAHQFSKLQLFEDVGVKTLQVLDSLYQLDNLKKSFFFKGLPQVLAQMPKRVSIQRVLPCLVKEYVNSEMIPFVLPNVLLIAEHASKEEFRSVILPDLVPVFKLQEPIQILLIFMQKMELLLTKCPPEDIRNHVLPMIYNSLEADAQQIQELCLNVIPSFAGLIEYPAMKNALLPRIKKLCISTSYLSVRVNCLVCLGKLLEHLDKWLVLDEILPLLPQIPSREPAVLMGILGIYKLAMGHKKLGITKEVLAGQVIPFLMPLTIENGLTLKQFNSLIVVVKEMVSQVENEHRAKLEQLNSIRQEQNSTLEMTKISSVSQDVFGDFASDGKKASMNELFQGLGLDTFISSESEPTENTSRVVKEVESLTMEDKVKLAKEQEMQQRFKSQPPMIPSMAAVAKPTSGPKDLTSTLINSNLANLNRISTPNYSPSFTTQPTPPTRNYSQTFPTPSAFGMQTSSSLSNNFSPSFSQNFGAATSYGTQPMASGLTQNIYPATSFAAPAQPMSGNVAWPGANATGPYTQMWNVQSSVPFGQMQQASPSPGFPTMNPVAQPTTPQQMVNIKDLEDFLK